MEGHVLAMKSLVVAAPCCGSQPVHLRFQGEEKTRAIRAPAEADYGEGLKIRMRSAELAQFAGGWGGRWRICHPAIIAHDGSRDKENCLI
jgi:hypothetical protein